MNGLCELIEMLFIFISRKGRIDCNKAEDELKTTPCLQNSLNALAIDELLEYSRLVLDGEMQT